MHERKSGELMRRVPVPDGVTVENIGAEYAKGKVTVKGMLLKETNPAEPQKIPAGSKKGRRSPWYRTALWCGPHRLGRSSG